MLKFKNSFINTLCTEAQKSIIDQQLAAVVIQGTKMVSKPCCNSPQATCRGSCCGSLHAEARAIVNYFGRSLSFNKKKNSGFHVTNTKNQKRDIVVIRVNRAGETCNARPCYKCLMMMKSVGIRRVYYSINSYEIICENVKDMVSIQASSVTRQLDKLKRNQLVDNTDLYYKDLLTKLFPSIIKRYNLDNFIAYNLSNVLPTYEVKIDKETNIVWILDNNKIPIIKSKLF
jgi:deoxycytidylate deaminase